MHVIQDANVALNALKTGVVQVDELPTSVVEAARAAGYEVQKTPTLVQHFLFLDRKTTFADENVRKAVCHAIDLHAVTEAGFDGIATPVTQRFLEGQYGFNPEVKAYDYDPELAKKYLAEAGNPKISLTLPMYATTATAMTLIAQMLREVGINADTQMMTTGQYFTYYQSDRYPLQVNTSATESIGPLDYYQFRFSPTGKGNPFKVTVPELDAIVAKALAEPDRAKQEVIWQEMIQYIHDHALDCNFYLYNTAWGYDGTKIKDLPTTVMRPSALRYDEVRLAD
jgi:ABC-type transport system substrate-binding protein